MAFPCRNENCDKEFSTKFNRNKHERIKRYAPENVSSLGEILSDDSSRLFKCPTIHWTTTSKYKHNIIKHLKSCYIVNKNKKAAGDNRICSICNKVFAKKNLTGIVM